MEDELLMQPPGSFVVTGTGGGTDILVLHVAHNRMVSQKVGRCIIEYPEREILQREIHCVPSGGYRISDGARVSSLLFPTIESLVAHYSVTKSSVLPLLLIPPPGASKQALAVVGAAGSSQFALSRAAAVAMLAEVPEGSFILRPSSTAIEDWVLSYAYGGDVVHEIVVKDTWSNSSRLRQRNGYFVLSSPSESFKQLPDAVRNCQLCPVLKCRLLPSVTASSESDAPAAVNHRLGLRSVSAPVHAHAEATDTRSGGGGDGGGGRRKGGRGRAGREEDPRKTPDGNYTLIMMTRTDDSSYRCLVPMTHTDDSY